MRFRHVLLGLSLLALLGMVPAHPVPLQALILRDGGSIVVDLQPKGRLRLDRAYGSRTHGEFFYENGETEHLTAPELQQIYPDLKRQKVKLGGEYYQVFLDTMAKKLALRSPAGSHSPASRVRPRRATPGARQ